MPFRLSTRWDGASHTFELLPGENLVGSEPGCDVSLSHPGVSRHHAVLLVLDDSVEVADLGSQNGTFVEGRRLTQKTTVTADAALAFGAVEARLQWLREDDAQPAALPTFDGPGGEGGARSGEEAELETPSGETAIAGSPATPPPATTASVGPLQLFALVHLPRLVDTLDGLAANEAESAARAAGEALAASLPCTALSITLGRGLLYRTGELDAPGSEASKASHSASASAGDLELSVSFGSASSARLYGPIVGTVVRLLALSTRRGAASNAPSERQPSSVPPWPEPATLDPALRKVYKTAARVARSDQSVLILGASGTGKEVLARYVHRASARSDGPFVALNCAALPDDLLEAELFGIEKGVATGVDARPGRFEQAHGGTLFLDEIGDMAAAVQAKILRVLQEKEVHRLGSLSPREADVRVVSATHQDLDALRAVERFRDDLYHRIADWRLRLPELAERAVDIPNLASYFLAREARRRGIEARGISRAALRVLCRHPWPGNVRQLEKEVAKATLFVEDGGLLDTGCLDDELLQASPPETTLREHLERVECREIRRALAATGHDVPRAAEDLGLPESTLYRKIRSLGLESSSEVAVADEES